VSKYVLIDEFLKGVSRIVCSREEHKPTIDKNTIQKEDSTWYHGLLERGYEGRIR
jgi:hypothetical protein